MTSTMAKPEAETETPALEKGRETNEECAPEKESGPRSRKAVRIHNQSAEKTLRTTGDNAPESTPQSTPHASSHPASSALPAALPPSRPFLSASVSSPSPSASQAFSHSQASVGSLARCPGPSHQSGASASPSCLPSATSLAPGPTEACASSEQSSPFLALHLASSESSTVVSPSNTLAAIATSAPKVSPLAPPPHRTASSASASPPAKPGTSPPFRSSPESLQGNESDAFPPLDLSPRSSPSSSSAPQHTRDKRRQMHTRAEHPAPAPGDNRSLSSCTSPSSHPRPSPPLPVDEATRPPTAAGAKRAVCQASPEDPKGAKRVTEGSGAKARAPKPPRPPRLGLQPPASAPLPTLLASQLSAASGPSLQKSLLCSPVAEAASPPANTRKSEEAGGSPSAFPQTASLLEMSADRLARTSPEQRTGKPGENEDKTVDDTKQQFLRQLREHILGAAAAARHSSGLPAAVASSSSSQAGSAVEGALERLAQAVESLFACGGASSETGKGGEERSSLGDKGTRGHAGDDVSPSLHVPRFLPVAHLLQQLLRSRLESPGPAARQVPALSRPIRLLPQPKAPASAVEPHAPPLRQGADGARASAIPEGERKSGLHAPSSSLLQASSETAEGGTGSEGEAGVPGVSPGVTAGTARTSERTLSETTPGGEPHTRPQPPARHGVPPAQVGRAGGRANVNRALSARGETGTLGPSLGNPPTALGHSPSAIQPTEVSSLGRDTSTPHSNHCEHSVAAAPALGPTGVAASKETPPESDPKAHSAQAPVTTPSSAGASGLVHSPLRPVCTAAGHGAKGAAFAGAHAGRKGDAIRGGKKDFAGGEEGDKNPKGRGCCRKGTREEGEGDKRSGRAVGRDSEGEASARERAGQGSGGSTGDSQPRSCGLGEPRPRAGTTEGKKAPRASSRHAAGSGPPASSARPRVPSKPHPKREPPHSHAAAPNSSSVPASEAALPEDGAATPGKGCEVSPHAFPCCRRRLFCMHDLFGLFAGAGGTGAPSGEKPLGDTRLLPSHMDAPAGASLAQAASASSALLQAWSCLASSAERMEGREREAVPGHRSDEAGANRVRDQDTAGGQRPPTTHLRPVSFISLNAGKQEELWRPKLVDLLHAGQSDQGETARQAVAGLSGLSRETKKRRVGEHGAEVDRGDGEELDLDTRCESDSDDWEDDFSAAWLDSDEEMEPPLEQLRADICNALRTFFYFLHEAVEGLRPELLQAYRDHFAFLSSATRVAHLRNYEAILSRLKRRSPCKWSRLSIQMTFAELEAMRELHTHRQSTCKALLGHVALSTLFSPLSPSTLPSDRANCVEACFPFSCFVPSLGPQPSSCTSPVSPFVPCASAASSAELPSNGAAGGHCLTASAECVLSPPSSSRPVFACSSASSLPGEADTLQKSKRQSSVVALKSLAASLNAAAACVSVPGASESETEGSRPPLTAAQATEKVKKELPANTTGPSPVPVSQAESTGPVGQGSLSPEASSVCLETAGLQGEGQKEGAAPSLENLAPSLPQNSGDVR
ncbi:conserved hypothetical protein [Neospora caninum Liverpool]|uniref:Uncharacterized protein n=1 Tax=Neospora caninum (strain Liverpool) TaxID=572307 RepID=F0VAA6_NEOCL|nr:conserved hypothetical protein [Neospora caninum Liverpool]CBZ50595.1 conserved hypothetical protein [Neospora caninum Liverpool]CEL65208.1 TPA: hypothetical protein BN1204_010640 [Neospora caninum Liverpool]|eukprot:XP_003880628.1 conserved hypothetical protein [Neospora caninum Liverpool]